MGEGGEVSLPFGLNVFLTKVHHLALPEKVGKQVSKILWIYLVPLEVGTIV